MSIKQKLIDTLGNIFGKNQPNPYDKNINPSDPNIRCPENRDVFFCLCEHDRQIIADLLDRKNDEIEFLTNRVEEMEKKLCPNGHSYNLIGSPIQGPIGQCHRCGHIEHQCYAAYQNGWFGLDRELREQSESETTRETKYTFGFSDNQKG